MNCLLLLALAMQLACSSPDGEQLEASLQRIEDASWRATAEGHGAEYFRTMQAELGFLRSRNDHAAALLVRRLEELSRVERSFVKDGGDSPGYSKYVRYQLDRKESPILSQMLAHLLSEMYPALSPNSKAAAIGAIEQLFVPFQADKARNLNWAYLRIGADSVPTSIRFLRHANPGVRCSAAEQLNGIVEAQTAGSLKNKPPSLDCQLPAKRLEHEASQWQIWWSEGGSKDVVFPQVPSTFEAVSDGRSRPR